jgi:hypothetical protein
MNSFISTFREAGEITFPLTPCPCRIQLMPIRMHDPSSLPDYLSCWRDVYSQLCRLVSSVDGVGYLTIDQKWVEQGEYHRRPGLHVDGMAIWGAGGSWGGRGMLVASDTVGCAAWKQEFQGQPMAGTDAGDPNEGNCDHLRRQCREDCKYILRANKAYWCDAMCVHESLPITKSGYRTFVRLSLPSNGQWPRNCTPNPKVEPAGEIGPARRIEGKFGY